MELVLNSKTENNNYFETLFYSYESYYGMREQYIAVLVIQVFFLEMHFGIVQTQIISKNGWYE